MAMREQAPLLADRSTEVFARQVIVYDRPAGGVVAAETAARAASD